PQRTAMSSARSAPREEKTSSPSRSSTSTAVSRPERVRSPSPCASRCGPPQEPSVRPTSSGSSNESPGVSNTPLERRSATESRGCGQTRTEPARSPDGTQIDSAASAREVCELVEKRYVRRGFALAVTAAMAFAACTPTTGGTSSPTPGGSASASVAPAARGAGGDLKILYWQAPTILNPHQAGGTKDNDASR